MAQGMVPLCSKQYERMFNMTRVPGIETDRIVHYQVRELLCGSKSYLILVILEL